jgi:hypothetical protein
MPLSAAPPTPPPPPPGFVAHKKSPWTVPFAQAPEGTKSHHVAAVKLALQDINARRNEYWFPVPSGLTCLLEEERDLPMLATFSNITLLVGGSAVALFTFSEPVRPASWLTWLRRPSPQRGVLTGDCRGPLLRCALCCVGLGVLGCALHPRPSLRRAPPSLLYAHCPTVAPPLPGACTHPLCVPPL